MRLLQLSAICDSINEADSCVEELSRRDLYVKSE
jgi:hypothetical protein